LANNVLKMKELESRTGVSRESIRFYIREGILPQPEKPLKNVAHYNEDHVLRIRLIKKLQEEKFMPLGRIKALLKSVKFSELATMGNLAEFEFTFSSLVNGDVRSPDTSLDIFVQESNYSHQDLIQMHEMGIIHIKTEKAVEYIDSFDVSVLDKWHQIKTLGFEDKFGYDLNFLLQYVEAARKISIREVDQFFEAFASSPVKAFAELGAKGVQLANDLIAELHTREVRARIANYVDQTDVSKQK
jgi:DNA-binding transcriptional MerR regulator